MATKFKVVRKKHQCQTPIEALQLGEDILRLKLASEIISQVSIGSISDSAEEREQAHKDVWSATELLGKWRRNAERKLRRDFLCY